MTRKQQIEIIQEAIEIVIQQAVEVSCLRNWLIYHYLRSVKPEDAVSGEEIIDREGVSLSHAFEGIIDPDDTEFWNSRWSDDGSKDPAEIDYEEQPI